MTPVDAFRRSDNLFPNLARQRRLARPAEHGLLLAASSFFLSFFSFSGGAIV